MSQPYGNRSIPDQLRALGWRLPVVIVGLLALLVVGADRGGAAIAAGQMRAQINKELTSRDIDYGSLRVGIGGFPFLNQVASRTFDQLTIDLRDMRIPAADATGTPVDISSLHVVATGVEFDPAQLMGGLDQAQVTAADITGTVEIPYSALDGLVGMSSQDIVDTHFSESDGALQLDATADLLLTQAPFHALADVSAEGTQLHIKLRDANVVGMELPDLGRALIDLAVAITLQATLPDLPFSLVFNEVTVGHDGLRITVTAHDVPLGPPTDAP